ncbi:MAG: ABC transporter permease subunit [Ignavibacteriaceae bacterium]|jgi:ABC-type nitrate/sulfonate/bicarbonate transport system permease component
MRLKTAPAKNLYKYIISYFVLWILLFEFILPSNNILPKPSVVLLSFSALWHYYKLLFNFTVTISAVYLSILLAYFLTSLLSGYIVRKNHFVSEFLLSLHWFSHFIPAIVFGLFLIYWLPGSAYIEYLFAFFIALFSLVIRVNEEAAKVKHEYISSAVSLGVGESVIAKKVIWKSIQPAIIKYLIVLQFNIWSVLIAFEFIKGGYGLGRIYRLALDYNDLSVLFTISIIVGITIYLGTQLIKYFKNKFYHWSLD